MVHGNPESGISHYVKNVNINIIFPDKEISEPIGSWMKNYSELKLKRIE